METKWMRSFQLRYGPLILVLTACDEHMYTLNHPEYAFMIIKGEEIKEVTPEYENQECAECRAESM